MAIKGVVYSIKASQTKSIYFPELGSFQWVWISGRCQFYQVCASISVSPEGYGGTRVLPFSMLISFDVVIFFFDLSCCSRFPPFLHVLGEH